MFNFIKKNKAKILATPNLREDIKNQVMADEYHHWIRENKYIASTFEEMIDSMPLWSLEKWSKLGRIIFLSSSGKYSNALYNVQAHVIIVYPELMRLLRSTAMSSSLAILLHEMGHLIHEHAKKGTDPLQAQIEADLFAAQAGYFEEIEQILLEQPESIEKRARLSYLTMEYFKQGGR